MSRGGGAGLVGPKTIRQNVTRPEYSSGSFPRACGATVAERQLEDGGAAIRKEADEHLSCLSARMVPCPKRRAKLVAFEPLEFGPPKSVCSGKITDQFESCGRRYQRSDSEIDSELTTAASDK